ncbi:MAG: protein translocase subunit SecD [Treponema sp.]|jgi:preprotein translocase subunit SecD|nr:protein translocase subunit SecD [Treponema sp.]
MSKRYRFFLLLGVLVVCFLFLLPTIRWYFFTPRDSQALALETRQQIRTYASQAAQGDLQRLVEAARTDGAVPADLEFLSVMAKKMYKTNKLTVPDPWTSRSVLEAFTSRREALDAIENKYRDDIFALKDLQKNAVKLGLDLSGGLSIVLQANLDTLSDRLGRPLTDGDRSDAMARALEVLNSRIDRFGLTEPVIRRQGVDQIYVEIPGTADPERINDIIMGKGSLAFHLEDTDATELFYNYFRANPTTTFDASGRLINPNILPPDVKILGYYIKDRYGLDEQARNIDGSLRYIAVKREIGLDGNYIEEASVERNHMDGKPEVAFRLSNEGGEIFYQLTSSNIGRNLAIVLDDRIRSNARIQSGIRDRGQITGFGVEEADNIALVLRTAALPVELEVASQQSIGASMGEDTIRQGLYALLGGVASVLIFMLIYYKSAGINAIIAQILNFYIMFSVLSALNFTLTLPAIAGFILTIGMAVDASVIIFERMKEEMRLGKTRKAVIEAGFDKAFWAIMDSNITTFIAALFLSQLGSGPIRGFAVTLAIGVFSSVFTALFVSRLIFDFSTDVIGSKDLSVSWRYRIQTEALKADTVKGAN